MANDISLNDIVPSDATLDPIKAAQWGIDNTLAGWIIQSESITKELVTDITQDQKGRVIGQLDYDHHWTCTIDIIGNGTVPTAGDNNFSYNDYIWKVMSVVYNGAFNDKKKWTISLERYALYPTEET